MPHIHEKIDFCSEVFIVYKDKVLLRKHDKYKIWLSIGGHIEHDEDPCEAALREVNEEVGLDVELFDADDYPIKQTPDWRLLCRPIFVIRHRINPSHEHIGFVFYALARTDRIQLSSREKTEDCRWFKKEELEALGPDLTDAVKFCAKDALKRLSLG